MAGESLSVDVEGIDGESGRTPVDRSRDIGKRVLSQQDVILETERNRQIENTKKIREAFQGIANPKIFSLDGMPLASDSEEGFSGDAASLFMLVKFHDGGEDRSQLVKIGWGEFSKQVFTKNNKSKYSNDELFAAKLEVLQSLPFDVYCVGQHESHLALDEKIVDDMYLRPEKFLKEHALFVANNGRVVMSAKKDRGHHELDYDIRPISEEEARASIEQMKELYHKVVEGLGQND